MLIYPGVGEKILVFFLEPWICPRAQEKRRVVVRRGLVHGDAPQKLCVSRESKAEPSGVPDPNAFRCTNKPMLPGVPNQNSAPSGVLPVDPRGILMDLLNIASAWSTRFRDRRMDKSCSPSVRFKAFSPEVWGCPKSRRWQRLTFPRADSLQESRTWACRRREQLAHPCLLSCLLLPSQDHRTVES